MPSEKNSIPSAKGCNAGNLENVSRVWSYYWVKSPRILPSHSKMFFFFLAELFQPGKLWRRGVSAVLSPDIVSWLSAWGPILLQHYGQVTDPTTSHAKAILQNMSPEGHGTRIYHIGMLSVAFHPRAQRELPKTPITKTSNWPVGNQSHKAVWDLECKLCWI